MPTQQRPNRVLTESSADQFYLIRQLHFQKLVLASQFLFARYFLRLAREVVPLQMIQKLKTVSIIFIIASYCQSIILALGKQTKTMKIKIFQLTPYYSEYV
ncbi:Hypothetical_protein [Hexamita inflata]|uniref:Hypothetical_protein n=1 Tax=Hexamita inflata TaxID=28002 RepID=A0ABP1GDM3_9EUKA